MFTSGDEKDRHFGKSLAASHKVKHAIILWSRNPFLDIFPREIKIYFHIKSANAYIRFIIAGYKPNIHQLDNWLTHIVAYLYIGVLFSIKSETTYNHNTMGKSQALC